MQNSSHGVTRVIHWGMAVFVIAMLTFGFYMKNTESYEYYALHKSLGVLAILLIALRFYWRSKHPWQSSMQHTKLEKSISRVHLILLLLLTLMPTTGLLLSGLGGFGVAFFDVPLIPANYDTSGQAVPFNQTLSEFGYIAHEILGYLLSALVIIHMLAAFKHHFIDKDNTLNRMLGK